MVVHPHLTLLLRFSQWLPRAPKTKPEPLIPDLPRLAPANLCALPATPLPLTPSSHTGLVIRQPLTQGPFHLRAFALLLPQIFSRLAAACYPDLG